MWLVIHYFYDADATDVQLNGSYVTRLLCIMSFSHRKKHQSGSIMFNCLRLAVKDPRIISCRITSVKIVYISYPILEEKQSFLSLSMSAASIGPDTP